MRDIAKRYAIVFVAWLPFFAIWVLFAVVYAHYPLRSALATSAMSMGSASLLGIGVWHICRRYPWPLRMDVKFYLLHVFLASAYSLVWNIVAYALEALHRGAKLSGFWSSPLLGWELLTGLWIYGLLAGVSYAVETRKRLYEKERLATAAQLDAIRARLNPHFLFNALHTLSALVKFRPAMAEPAIERLGDMLRYTLKEDTRELVEFSEEYEFTRQYIAFEQLRYEERLQVHMHVEPEAYQYDVPSFSMQTLAENAVRHAISIRPEGGSIWIRCSREEGRLKVSVRDDGPGGGADGGQSHQFGLRSLRERLCAAYGADCELCLRSGPDGFEASFLVPGGDRQ